MSNPPKPSRKAFERWTGNRLGMFIHWGLYALPARHEWVKKFEKITTEGYQKYFDNFDPDLYNPEEWAAWAKKAGMKYVVLTTRHHEGFCLWDSKFTDYKSTNTPAGRDLLTPFVKAFRDAGIRIGLYYSLMDWHHPDYGTDIHHPMNDNEEFKKGDAKRDISKYAKYMRDQLTELLTQFGEIDMLFLDFSVKDHATGKIYKGRDAWESEKLVKLLRKLQPEMLINDRLDLDDSDWGWDFRTPEQIMLREPMKHNGKEVPWETCQTFSGSWGYHRDEASWKSEKQLLTMLIDTVSKNGNLLLNVGPTARGEFDSRAKDRLGRMGEWMARHGRSIYGCGAAPKGIPEPQDCRLTYNPETKRLYIHVFNWPPTGEIYIDGLGGKVDYAQLLNDASEIRFGAREQWQMGLEGMDKGTVSLKLPVLQPDVSVPVLELILK